MKNNIKLYLQSLFANTPHTPANDALFEELLGNLYDRYDELTAAGLAPAEAYARVIGEVGDIEPLLEKEGDAAVPPTDDTPKADTPDAPPQKKKKKKRRFLIPFLIVLLALAATITALALIAVHYDIQIGFYFEDTDVADYTEVGSATVAGEVDRLSVVWYDGHVTVETYDGDTVEIYETNNGNDIADEKDEMHWYLEDGHLRIRFDGRGFLRFRFGKVMEKQLIVRVPKDSALLTSLAFDIVSANLTVTGVGAEGAFSVSSVSGEINLTDITAAPFEVDGVSGALTVEGGSFTKVGIDTVSGAVTLKNVTAAKLEVDSVSGNAALTACAFSEIEMDTTSGRMTLALTNTPKSLAFDSTSGDLILTLSESVTGFTVEFDSVSGKLENDFPTTHSGDTHRYGDGQLEIEMDSTSGNLYIKKAE